MSTETNRQWTSMVTTSLWGTELEEDVEPCCTAFGEEFTPTSAEWIRYRFGEFDSGEGSKYEDYTIVYVLNDEYSAAYDLRVQEIPEWIPRPPQGWDFDPEDFAKAPQS